MSLTLEPLDNDKTFLLAFAPAFAPVGKANSKASRKFPGAFTILLDPWLQGSTSILHPLFQQADHTAPVSLTSLAELKPPPDLIIISQDYPDHCNRETLTTLPKDARTKILATPSAAKKIKSWKHFDDGIVHLMRPYSPEKEGVITRIKLEAYTSSSSAGEVTVANVVTKYDLTGLHNAVAITYRPPGSLLTLVTEAGGGTVSLKDMHGSHALTALRGTLVKKASAVTLPGRPITDPEEQGVKKNRAKSFTSADAPAHVDRAKTDAGIPPPLPFSDQRRITSHISTITRSHKERTLSVVYTPHGIAPLALRQYLSHHLDIRPYDSGSTRHLDVLLHCFNMETNPAILGGRVANGAPAGVEVVKEARARWWLGCHDEIKELRGWSTKWLRSKRFTVDEVRSLVKQEAGIEEVVEVRRLETGQRLRVDG